MQRQDDIQDESQTLGESTEKSDDIITENALKEVDKRRQEKSFENKLMKSQLNNIDDIIQNFNRLNHTRQPNEYEEYTEKYRKIIRLFRFY